MKLLYVYYQHFAHLQQTLRNRSAILPSKHSVDFWASWKKYQKTPVYARAWVSNVLLNVWLFLHCYSCCFSILNLTLQRLMFIQRLRRSVMLLQHGLGGQWQQLLPNSTAVKVILPDRSHHLRVKPWVSLLLWVCSNLLIYVLYLIQATINPLLQSTSSYSLF